MTRDEVKKRLEKVFREVFDDETIVITDDTSADDIDAWDSLTHVELIVAVEEEFEMKLSAKEIVRLKNVGEFINLIHEKAGA